MRWLIWREMTVALRSAAFWAGVSAHVVFVSAFVLVWGDGVPVFSGRSVFAQLSVVHGFGLTVLLPWVAARCQGGDARHLARLAVAAAVRPSRLVAARYVASAAVLAALVSTALPLVAVALRISALPIRELLTVVPGLAIVCTFAAVVTTACMLTAGSRVAGWLTATLATVTVASFGPSRPAVAAAMVALAVVIGLGVARWADADWRYPPDQAYD
jgi:hypothetical protein